MQHQMFDFLAKISGHIDLLVFEILLLVLFLGCHALALLIKKKELSSLFFWISGAAFGAFFSATIAYNPYFYRTRVELSERERLEFNIKTQSEFCYREEPNEDIISCFERHRPFKRTISEAKNKFIESDPSWFD